MTVFAGRITLNTNESSSLLVGELTRHTVMQITKKDIKQLISKQSSIIDLQQVTRIDTAGLAWLFGLLEQAYQKNCQLSFCNVPAKLDKLISLSGVEGFLPLST